MKKDFLVTALMSLVIMGLVVGCGKSEEQAEKKVSEPAVSSPSKAPAGGYGAPPQPAGGYGAPPQPAGGYGAPPQPAGGYGAPAPQ